jgi:hypothetical protein
MSITGPILAVAAIGAASSVAGGVMQANAAGNAAQAQETAAQQAQQLEQQNQQQGISFQQNEWAGQQQAEQPYQQLGQTSANAYANLINNPFTAPTLAQAQQTPGYQFNLQTGTQAINENAAATGNLLSGNTGTALQKYGQGLATTTYQQAYQNALNQYTTNLNAAGQGVNVGLSSTGQLGQFGQAAANNLSNLYLTGGQQQASQINNKGAAQAAGYIGAANAYSNMFNGIANSADQGIALGSYGGGFNSGSLSDEDFYSPDNGFPAGATAANPYATVAAPPAYNPNSPLLAGS